MRPAERRNKSISTHAPRTGSDLHNTPTPPAGDISTHAPRTGSDQPATEPCASANIFQPTLPARGATTSQMTLRCPDAFQPTLPARGATLTHRLRRVVLTISTHAPRTGSDQERAPGAPGWFHFNPRSPHGERRLSDVAKGRKRPHFNPRSPHGERQRKVTILSIRIIGFAQKVYHKTVLLRISLAENAVILPEKPRNPVRTSLQKAGGLRFARAIRAARPYSISSPSGA